MSSKKNSLTRFIFILIDGAPYQIFKELVADGTLPNIKKYVIDRGSIKKAVSVFPSTTGPAFIPFFMGLFPGTANIPGIRWLSKTKFQNPHRFLRPGVCSYMGIDGVSFNADLPAKPTLFNFFSSVSNIYNLLTSGCPPSKDRTRFLKPLVYTYAHFSHQWKFVHAIASRKLLKAVEAGDKFVMCLFSGVDAYSHFSHTQSSLVIDAYREIDQTVGKVCRILQQSGDFDNTLILITSDHGMTNTHTHIDIARHLDKSGWCCLHHPLPWRHNARCASMVSGNGMAHIYFKSEPNRWGERLSFERLSQMGVVETLLELNGLDFVAGQSEDGSIIVQKRTGQGKIAYANGMISYRFNQVDPLGYGTPYENLSFRDALIQTYDSAYPDGLVQLWQLFQAERTGDLVLSAQSGYDLRARYEYPEHHATHGALIAEQMVVPLAVNLPIDTEFIRTVDLFPTILSAFGYSIQDNPIDGQVIR